MCMYAFITPIPSLTCDTQVLLCGLSQYTFAGIEHHASTHVGSDAS